MKEILKEINILNNKLTYYEEDNGRKKTILFIHGFNSSTEFMSEIVGLNSQYNLIALNLPGSKFSETNKPLSLNHFVDIVDVFIKKNINRRKIILLGHSLGGSVISHLYKNKKVKEMVFLSPLNPSLVKDKKYELLKSIHFPKNKLDHLKTKVLSSVAAKTLNSDFIKEFISDDSKYIGIIKNNILNIGYMEAILDNNFKKCVRWKHPHFLIGAKDPVINPVLFEDYVTNELNRKVHLFYESKHNPINSETQEFVDYLTKNFHSKKTIFKRNLIKI